MKCRDCCKWLGYSYTTDENGHILGETGFRCEKYKVDLGKRENRCKECMKETK